MKLRILRENDRYYPQYRKFFFWCCWDDWSLVDDDTDWPDTLFFYSYEEARSHIKSEIEKLRIEKINKIDLLD